MSRLVIIGGGPAGCAAAISACAQGFPVTLIEARHPARHLPGETLHPGVEPIFHQLGVWDSVAECGFLRHQGVWRIALDGSEKFEAYGADESGSWEGLQVDRVQLHQILRDQAVKLGTQWMTVSSLANATRGDRGWSIETNSGESITGTIALDATGRHSWLATQLGLPAEKLLEPHRIRFGWLPTSSNLPDHNPVFRLHHDGWEWNAPVGNDRKAWVRMRRGNRAQGLDVTPRIYRKSAGPGWFLLGDAACLTTPASGNGVLRALMSGIFAVHCMATVRSGTMTPQDAAEAYCLWISKFWESSVSGSGT